MRLTDEFNENTNQTGLPVVFMAVGVISFMILILIVVFALNAKPKRNQPVQNVNGVQVQESVKAESENTGNEPDSSIGQSSLTSDQLDFWDMYKEDDEPVRTPIPTVSGSSYEQKEKELMEENKEEDLSEGGIKTKVVLPDGTEQWVMINSYIKKHNYDFLGLVKQEPIMKYYEDAENVSKMGIHLNKSSGNVNFNSLKSEGIDFVILRVAARGYQNGNITMDDKFEEYIAGAKAAGLEVGLSFYSQAITAEEAVEEANTLIGMIGENQIKYPIVFDMELVSNDSSRIEQLSKMNLTDIADTFCRTIKEAGYTPMIYGDKYWLLRKLDLTKLSDYDIWLSQEEEKPDYPYQFAMWEYTKNAEIKGVQGDASLSISFIDYTMR